MIRVEVWIDGFLQGNEVETIVTKRGIRNHEHGAER